MGRAGDGNTDRRRRGRRPASVVDDEPRTWQESAQTWPDGDFAVRRVSGTSDGRVYRCPGCDQELPSSLPHTVAWPEGRLDERRHWHTVCWAKRLHRAPVVQRSRNAPRL